MDTLTMTQSNCLTALTSMSVCSSSICSVPVRVRAQVRSFGYAAEAAFAAYAVASIGADAAAPVAGVWGLPCTSLVTSTRTETSKTAVSTMSNFSNMSNNLTNKRHNTMNKPATTWLLRPSGVQGDPPV